MSDGLGRADLKVGLLRGLRRDYDLQWWLSYARQRHITYRKMRFHNTCPQGSAPGVQATTEVAALLSGYIGCAKSKKSGCSLLSLSIAR
jgi:hypothetical protein